MTTAKLELFKSSPSSKMYYHTNPKCFALLRDKSSTISEVSPDQEKEMSKTLKICSFCAGLGWKRKSPATSPVPDSKVKTSDLNNHKQFVPPLTTSTNTELSIPINLTDTLTINGVKYVREDTIIISDKPKVLGIIVMEDGSEYSLVK
jgi:hypothetical protein